MASVVNICNLALAHLGDSANIVNIALSIGVQNFPLIGVQFFPLFSFI